MHVSRLMANALRVMLVAQAIFAIPSLLGKVNSTVSCDVLVDKESSLVNCLLRQG
jgi:hypothetical protein